MGDVPWASPRGCYFGQLCRDSRGQAQELSRAVAGQQTFCTEFLQQSGPEAWSPRGWNIQYHKGLEGCLLKSCHPWDATSTFFQGGGPGTGRDGCFRELGLLSEQTVDFSPLFCPVRMPVRGMWAEMSLSDQRLCRACRGMFRKWSQKAAVCGVRVGGLEEKRMLQCLKDAAECCPESVACIS